MVEVFWIGAGILILGAWIYHKATEKQIPRRWKQSLLRNTILLKQNSIIDLANCRPVSDRLAKDFNLFGSPMSELFLAWSHLSREVIRGFSTLFVLREGENHLKIKKSGNMRKAYREMQPLIDQVEEFSSIAKDYETAIIPFFRGPFWEADPALTALLFGNTREGMPMMSRIYSMSDWGISRQHVTELSLLYFAPEIKGRVLSLVLENAFQIREVFQFYLEDLAQVVWSENDLQSIWSQGISRKNPMTPISLRILSSYPPGDRWEVLTRGNFYLMEPQCRTWTIKILLASGRPRAIRYLEGFRHLDEVSIALEKRANRNRKYQGELELAQVESGEISSPD